MANIKTHTETVGDISYSCKTFPASEGLVLLPKIVSLIGDKVANLVFGVGEEGIASIMEDSAVMTTIMVRISERAEENNGLLVVKDLLKYTTYKEILKDPNGSTHEMERSAYDEFDDHFAAKYMHLLQVAFWVGRASFGNP